MWESLILFKFWKSTLVTQLGRYNPNVEKNVERKLKKKNSPVSIIIVFAQQ